MKYIVLTEKHKSIVFDNHTDALAYCESTQCDLCKTVYQMINAKTLGPLNIYGGAGAEKMVQQIWSKEFTFKVI